jgi:beta-lactamase class A
MQMIFLKKTKIPQILFSILVLSSCGKDKKTDTANTPAVEDTLPKMKPLGPEKKISQAYKNSVTARINHFYNKNWPNNSMNGSFLVARNGQIIFERYNGFANKNEGTKITADTPVQIASVSKVLTATAVLKLVNAGKIDLDQKVNTILKTFPY